MILTIILFYNVAIFIIAGTMIVFSNVNFFHV